MAFLERNERDLAFKLLAMMLRNGDSTARRDALIPSIVKNHLTLAQQEAGITTFVMAILDVTESAGEDMAYSEHPILDVLDRACLLMGADDHGVTQLAVRLNELRIAIRARIAVAAQPVPAAVDPYASCRVIGGQPFMNRVDLRRYLRDLAEQNLAASQAFALLVNGPSKSGKTYTRQLISYLEKSRRIPKVITVDLKDMPRDLLMFEEIIARLARRVNFDYTALRASYKTTSIDRWIRDACADLTAHIEEKRIPCWIVLDSIALNPDPDPNPEVGPILRQLGQELVLKAVNSDYLRVVLLGFPEVEIRALDSHVPALVRCDRTLDEVPLPELESFFQQHFDALGLADVLSRQARAIQRLREELGALPAELDRFSPEVLYPALHRIFPGCSTGDNQ